MAANLGVLVLAAGRSHRMGQSKQLLPVLGEPAICCCVGRICDAGLDNIIVVLGANRDRIRPVLRGLPVNIAVNARAGSQMADSIRCGLAHLPEGISGVMVALCDHPLVSPDTYARLHALHRRDPESILLPVYNRRGGHPTVFPRQLCSAVDTGTALNAVVRANPDRVCRIPVDDPAIVRDMDTPGDYQRMLGLASRQMGDARD